MSDGSAHGAPTAGLRVVVGDDHDLLVEAMSTALELEGYEVLRPPALDSSTVLAFARRTEPRVALLDLHLADDRRAVDMIGPLRDAGCRVVMVTSEREEVALAECVEAGADGLVHKSAPLGDLIDAVHDVACERTRITKARRQDLLRLLDEHRRATRDRLAPFEALTPRERRVLGGLMDGLTTEAIARRDCVSITTARTQVRSIFLKLGVNSQLSAVVMARAAGWTPDEVPPRRT